jgi:hypothetical protein
MQYLTFNLDHAAATAQTQIYIPIPIDMRLDSVNVIPSIASAAHAANYTTFSLRDAANSADVVSINTVAGWTGGTAVAATLSNDLDYDAGEDIMVKAVKSGTGADINVQVTLGLVARRTV